VNENSEIVVAATHRRTHECVSGVLTRYIRRAGIEICPNFSEQASCCGAENMPISISMISTLLIGLAVSAQTSAKDTGYLFVSNEQTNNVAVIDPTQQHRVINWIRTSSGPRGMAFRNGREQLLVACGADNVIDVIDVARLAVIDHIPTGANPDMFELSRDQKTIYVSYKEGSAVHEIDVEEKLINREISTGAKPSGIAGSSDGKTLYVTSEISDWVHFVDLAVGAVTDNIEVGTRPRHLLLIPGGNELWVSNESSGQVSIIDRATKHLAGTLEFRPPGFPPIDVRPLGLTTTQDGETAFVALGRANLVAFVDIVTRKIRHYVPVGRGTSGVALSADENTLYVANRGSDDVSIVDVRSHEVIKTVPVGGAPYWVQVDGSAAMPSM
jgi:PQQ-dependent catabolism-associated beta-propeller protein